jgi:uncharacterized protein YdeI (BOF family)
VKRIVLATAIALLSVSAFAQEQKGPLTARTDAQRKQDTAIDKAYQEAIKSKRNIDQSAKHDPWQSLRSTERDTPSR